MIRNKKIIVGAWKAYLTKAQAEDTASKLVQWRQSISKKSNNEIVLSPSTPVLISIHNLIKDTDISLCAQDVDPVSMGAHTGQTPPDLLKDVGCEYVLLGHSERRHLPQNDYNYIREKVKAALESELKVILCVGETKKQKDTNQTKMVLRNQLESALVSLDQKIVENNLSVAYEPVWAISSQNPAESPKPEEINMIHQYLRSVLHGKLDDEIANTVRILYGGSVNSDNVCGYLNQSLIDGVLVGSASTKSAGFINLLNAVEDKVLIAA